MKSRNNRLNNNTEAGKKGERKWENEK